MYQTKIQNFKDRHALIEQTNQNTTKHPRIDLI